MDKIWYWLEHTSKSILNTNHNANWQLIDCKYYIIIEETSEVIVAEEKPSLTKYAWKQYSTWIYIPYLGLYMIAAVANNDTIRACKGRGTNTFNMSFFAQYKE